MTATAEHTGGRRAATLTPTTLNDAARTVEVIVSTGAMRRFWFNGRTAEEVLVMTPDAIDLSALTGASVLDSHQQGSLDHVIGVVVDCWLSGGRLMARLHIDNDTIWTRIKAGTVRHISVGYTVQHAELAERDGQPPLITVTRWTPNEVSFVPVPADTGAHVRKEADMTGTNTPAASPAAAQTRGQINQGIRASAANYGLPATFADGLIDAEQTTEQAGQAILAEAARLQAAQTGGIAAYGVGARSDGVSPQQAAEAMGEALYARRHSAHQISDIARQFAYMSPVDMARHCLVSAGVSVNALPPTEIIQRAVGMHTSSDFTAVLGNFSHRELRTGYAQAESGIRQVARETTAQDFRAKSKIDLSTVGTLEKLTDSGEIKHGALIDSAESYRIDTFAKIITISRQALVNDDLDAIGDMASKFGQMAAGFEADFLVKALEGAAGTGPKMADGKVLFHADHGNLAASGAAPGETTLSAGRLAIRKQKAPSGEIIGGGPKFLIVPPELETAGEKLIATLAAAAVTDVNVFAGKLTLVVEPRLTSATRWYLSTDPAVVEGLEYAYLAGAPGPQVKTQELFNQDGVSFRVLLDFGAGFVDHRGWFMNPGQ